MPLDTDLHKSAHKGDIQVVKDLVLSGDIHVNAKGAQDRTALHRAAGANHIEIIEFLLEAGAPVNCADRCLRTPLHWAAISGHIDATQLLLASGGDLRQKTMSGMNPLMCAVQQRRHAVAEVILDWSASCNEEDAFSHTEAEAEAESDITLTPTPTPAELCSMTDVQGKTATVIAKEAGDVAMQKLLKLYAPAPSMLSTVSCCWPWSRAKKQVQQQQQQQQHAPVASVMTIPPSGPGSRQGVQNGAMTSSRLEERGRCVREGGGRGDGDFGVDSRRGNKTRKRGWRAWLCCFTSSVSRYEASSRETGRLDPAVRSTATTKSAALPPTSIDSDYGLDLDTEQPKPYEWCSSTSGTADIGGRSFNVGSEEARRGFNVLFDDNTISSQREGLRRPVPYYHAYRNPITANTTNVSVTCGPTFSEVEGRVGREGRRKGTSRERSAISLSSGGWHDSKDDFDEEWKKGNYDYIDTIVEGEESVFSRNVRRKRFVSTEGGQPWRVDNRARRGDESMRAEDGRDGLGMVVFPSATGARVGGGGNIGPWEEIEDSIR